MSAWATNTWFSFLWVMLRPERWRIIFKYCSHAFFVYTRQGTAGIHLHLMRYLGNKTSIIRHITDLLEKHSLLNQHYTFFDAFCGTGTVAYAVHNQCNIILNDNLLFATIYAKGRIVQDRCTFGALGCNPIDYLNRSEGLQQGFVYNNYSPAGGRMYFSEFNAQRIDFFRTTIEDWHCTNLINNDEYCYLLCCLMESISKVANVAGVYGAFLKTWDTRAKKNIQFIEPEPSNEQAQNNPLSVRTHNGNIEEIIDTIDCDILYLDPPYTHNSYSVQYHILETIIRNDNPPLTGITGARKYSNIFNRWSKKYEVEIALERVIAKTRAKHIVMSYSSDGIMSKDYILNVLKRYCYTETVEAIDIPYKQYLNSRAQEKEEHYEYLFYAEKKPIEKVEYYCPLNYMGGKTNVISQIRPYLTGKSKFLDVMGGGFNVGINVTECKEIRYNDINFMVGGLLQMFRDMPTADILKHIDKTIKRYGLQSQAQEPYLQLRKDYNEKYRNTPQGNLYLYTAILYGFQQQIRFNSHYEFNNPVGMSGYNDSIKEKIVSFSRRIKELSPIFTTLDFEATLPWVDANTLIYIDPPYLITLGSYNDGKRGFNGWNENEEERLLHFIDQCHEQGAKVVLSNILEYKELSNDLLKKWLQTNEAEIVNIPIRGRNEILAIL